MKASSSILVTGATGFIGNALVKRLIEMGMKVSCLVRSHSLLTKLPHAVEKITIDEFRMDSVTSALRNKTFDYVFHLAAYGVKPDQRDPIAMLQGNMEATTALLLCAQEWSLKRFVYTGSCAEYGEIADSLFVKESHPLKPTSLYGAAKVATSTYALTLAKQYDLPLAVLRLFGVYGPGEADYRLIPYLINLLKHNQRVDLSPGNQVRDFLYIDDVVNALLCAADEPLAHQPYNLCSSQPITVQQIGLQVAAAMGCDPHLLGFGERPYRLDEVMWLVGSNAAFTEQTTWRPTTPITEGIARMIAHSVETL